MAGNVNAQLVPIPYGPRYVTPASNPAPVTRSRKQHAVYGVSNGGMPFQGRVRGTAGQRGGAGWQANEDITRVSPPGNVNDKLIQKERGGIFRNAYYMEPATASGNLSWTAAGPVPTLLNMRKRNLRPIVGGSQSDRWGMHTNIPLQPRDLAGKNKMRPGRQSQLTVQVYRGQSYSSTTRVAGT